MGVTNLLPQLKDIQQNVSLTDYKGKTLAVDAYGWLHRGLILCAQDLCLQKPTQSYITSVKKKIDMLRYFGVEPYLVFDGASLPTKEATALQRREKRRIARETANQCIKTGNKKAAWKEFMKAAGVTPEMAKAIMVELDRCRVKYVVAPYEADPQMVYLEKIGLVDGILSEDSDLLVFGCKKLITKLNDHGSCVEIDRANLHKLKSEFDKFSGAQWRSLAILSGCDYTKGIPGVGMKTAYNAVVKHVTWEASVHELATHGKNAPSEFMEEAKKADLAFQYSKVFDPVNLKLTTLNEYPSDFTADMELVELCCGRSIDAEIQVGICLGKLHPSTHQPLYSRELLLKGFTPSASTDSTMKVKGNRVPRTIESFFNVQQQITHTSPMRLLRSVKNHCDKLTKLSPNAKKLRRIEPTASKCEPVSSKFFSSVQKMVPLKKDLANIQLPMPTSSSVKYRGTFEPQSSFLTSESEVPDESSSPVRNSVAGEHFVQYLTDGDDEIDSCLSAGTSTINSILERPLFSSTLTKSSVNLDSELNDGYVHEIEESPVKFTNIVTSWRNQFLVKETANLMSVTDASVSRTTSKSTRITAKLNLQPVINNKELQQEAKCPFEKNSTLHEALPPNQLCESDSELKFLETSRIKSTFELLQFAFSDQ